MKIWLMLLTTALAVALVAVPAPVAFADDEEAAVRAAVLDYGRWKIVNVLWQSHPEE
ncbi:MAG: hypothetical protein GY719_24455 [bacterium]|nr:hypothetical protein [bacterium]